MTASEAPAAPRTRLGALVQFALLAGPLLSMLDSSIVNVAVSPIAAELDAPIATVQWAVSGYLLALGIGLAATSYLARRFGTLPVYLTSVAAFTAASLLCALAPTAELLVAARVLQGLAGAPMVPLAMSMLLGSGGGARSMSPVAGIMLFLGPALGPSLGGVLIGVWGWRAIFLINIPIGVAAAISTRRIPRSLAPSRQPGTRFDIVGWLLLAAGLATLLFGAGNSETGGWNTPETWLSVIAGFALLGGYAAWAWRSAHPIVDLTLVTRLPAVLSLVLCAFASVVTYAAIFLLPVFMQTAQGYSALAAGAALLPQGVLTGLSLAFGPKLLTRLSVRMTVALGFALLTAASVALLAIDLATPLWVTSLVLACRAASIGLVISPLLAVMLRGVDDARLADANTLFSIWQRIAGSIGIAVIVTLFTQSAITSGPVAALHDAATALIALSGIALVGALFLPRGRYQALAAA
ncbi:multidrug efflux MFS transporter [Diaminobutyricibacter tongyongensis]|uniref:Multidrug efflux MFS transporter n=1 Tax=Leifsonia tongyongensis TaxID=1268043 RepID=A0A6L9XY84_9MICO|nr:DHA2 family efflux MFS transporter permease subunit [Diaminobutyricibacter tongyongensis]NEN06373.1 multidrug efflux MFS transporter [Diaminobutyricibacter tongyongensis]